MKVRKYFHDTGTLSKILTNKYAIANRIQKNIKKGVSTLKQLFKIMWILFVLISCGNENNKNISETETEKRKINQNVLLKDRFFSECIVK